MPIRISFRCLTSLGCTAGKAKGDLHSTSFQGSKFAVQVGLLDIDICGPSIPRMLGLEGEEIHQSGNGWSPVYVEDNLGVMSIGFMLSNKDDPIIWRGPRKNSLIQQFLKVILILLPSIADCPSCRLSYPSSVSILSLAPIKTTNFALQ